MNWDAIGAAGEIVGALAVVVSVAYLAVQIGKQTTESRLTASRELSTLYLQCLSPLRDDKELLSIYLKAVQDYEGLPREEQFRMSIFIQQAMRMFEQHYLHIQQQKVDQTFVDSINLSFEEWLTFPGIQRWWELSGDMFVPKFRDHVDTMIEKAKIRGYGSSFKQE
jgi:hypothetical protein